LDAEEKIIIAFLYKRSGSKELKESELYLTLSLELNWFSTADAQKFVDFAIKENLLKKNGEMLTPSFDTEKIKIPIGFSPSKPIYEKKEKETIDSVLEKVIERIIEKTDKSSEEVFRLLKNIQEGKKIIPEVAALLLAKTHDIRIDDLLEGVEKIIFKENEV
jgi:hypothetical protein